MELVSAPKTLYCSECDEEIKDAGYLPATGRDSGCEPLVDAAISDACGFNDTEMMGYAPALDEVSIRIPTIPLLYVRVTDDGSKVVSAKD